MTAQDASLIVLKVGGDVFESGSLPSLAADLAQLHREGHRLLVVHGGGVQASELQSALGQTPSIVAGRRITDTAALDVMKMVVGGRLNIDLSSALLAAGLGPVGLSGASSCAIRAAHRPPRVVSGGGPDPIDFGEVGDVTGVNLGLLELLLGGGYVPVLACLGADPTGRILNINADVVANQAACHLGAGQLVLVTGAPGVLRDRNDPSSRIPRLTVREARDAIADGSVAGGMIPKLDESIAAIESGRVGAIHIVGPLGAGDLLRELRSPGSVGTALLP